MHRRSARFTYPASRCRNALMAIAMSGSIGVNRREAPGKTHAEVLEQQYEERRRRQAAALAQLDCLTSVPTRDLLHLAQLCTLRAFAPGTPLLNERVPGEYLYLVLRGTVS